MGDAHERIQLPEDIRPRPSQTKSTAALQRVVDHVRIHYFDAGDALTHAAATISMSDNGNAQVGVDDMRGWLTNGSPFPYHLLGASQSRTINYDLTRHYSDSGNDLGSDPKPTDAAATVDCVL